MAVVKENDCVDCGLPCMGIACPNRNRIHKYCDVCGDEFDKVWKYENTVYCTECLITALEMDGVIKEAEYEDDGTF